MHTDIANRQGLRGVERAKHNLHPSGPSFGFRIAIVSPPSHVFSGNFVEGQAGIIKMEERRSACSGSIDLLAVLSPEFRRRPSPMNRIRWMVEQISNCRVEGD